MMEYYNINRNTITPTSNVLLYTTQPPTYITFWYML